MTTALDIVNDAAMELGIAATGQQLSAEDAQLMLRKLNQRLQTWSNSPALSIPTLTEISVPLTGTASYTVGPSGDVTPLRPLKVMSATAIDGAGVEWPVDVLNRDQWHGISYKNFAGGPPDAIWYDAQLTNGRVFVYPLSTAYTLKLQCTAALTGFASLSTVCTLPEGYELALGLTLAEDTAGSFQRQISPDLRMRAKGARAVVKRTNAEPLLLSIDTGGGETYQIQRGY